MTSLDWMVYALGAVAVVFLVAMFFKYKKHNRYADRFEDTYLLITKLIANTVFKLNCTHN